jgi:hypothetical protein
LAYKEFKQLAMQVINKYVSTSLPKRWQEALAFGKKEKADSYWIRDSEDVVNIVWLNSDGIRDITWHPSSAESMFNFVPLKSIVSFEVRERANAGKSLNVTGDFIIRVIQGGEHGDLWWVAENEESKQRLHAFLASVLKSYAKAMH